MSDSYTQPYAVANSDATTLIAGCFGDVIGGPDTAKENARLIAAAPELLQLAKSTFAFFDKKHNGCHDPLWHLAKEIIAKAEGQE